MPICRCPRRSIESAKIKIRQGQLCPIADQPTCFCPSSWTIRLSFARKSQLPTKRGMAVRIGQAMPGTGRSSVHLRSESSEDGFKGSFFGAEPFDAQKSQTGLPRLTGLLISFEMSLSQSLHRHHRGNSMPTPNPQLKAIWHIGQSITTAGHDRGSITRENAQIRNHQKRGRRPAMMGLPLRLIFQNRRLNRDSIFWQTRPISIHRRRIPALSLFTGKSCGVWSRLCRRAASWTLGVRYS